MSKNQWLFLAISPALLFVVDSLSSTFFYSLWGNWSWIPVICVYYLFITIIMVITGEHKQIQDAFKKSEGNYVWRILSLVFFFGATLPIFLSNYSLLNSPYLIILLILYSLINPFFEEMYWRKMLLDITGVNRILLVFVSSALFTVNHPLTLSFLHTSFTEPVFLIVTFLFGLMWSLTYIKTKSLRYNYITHAFINFASLSVLVFLNIYNPSFMF